MHCHNLWSIALLILRNDCLSGLDGINNACHSNQFTITILEWIMWIYCMACDFNMLQHVHSQKCINIFMLIAAFTVEFWNIFLLIFLVKEKDWCWNLTALLNLLFKKKFYDHFYILLCLMHKVCIVSFEYVELFI